MYVRALIPAVLLQLLLICHQQGLSVAQPSLIVSGPFYHRNARTSPNTIEMPHNQSWQFACKWIRRDAGEKPFMAITAPTLKGTRNCDFKSISGPAVCTPSSMEFQTDTGIQTSNLTCKEDGNTLTCSINFDSSNPRHIGVWSCQQDNRNDTMFLQYFKSLPTSSLVLASWDPVEPRNGTGANMTSNRFECFTRTVVIPPARLTFYLGGVELTKSQTRYPVDYLTDTVYTAQPNMYTVNESAPAATKTPPRSNLNLNQQLLASSRILELKLHRSYNGLLLQCVANQDLSESHPTASQGMVLHLDDRPPGNTADTVHQQIPILSSVLSVAAACVFLTRLD